MIIWFLEHNFFLMYLFFFGCVGSSFLCEGFLQLRQAGATPHRGVRASHCRGLSCCRAQAPDAQAQQLWLTGLAAPRHVGSSRIGTRTHVPCIGRRILNHCATREALGRCVLNHCATREVPLWFVFVLFCFWPHCTACRILVPKQGSNPRPLQWKHRFLTTAPPGKSPCRDFNVTLKSLDLV